MVSSVSCGLFYVSGHWVCEALRSSTVAPQASRSTAAPPTSASWPQVQTSAVHMTVTKRWEGKTCMNYLHACLVLIDSSWVCCQKDLSLSCFVCFLRLSVGKLTIGRQWGDAKDIWHGGQRSPDNRPWWAHPCIYVCLFVDKNLSFYIRPVLCKLLVWQACVFCFCVLWRPSVLT